jgi:hypothetical protein
MIRVLAEKDAKFINENFDYVAEVYEKKEEDNLQTLKESTTPKSKGADVNKAQVAGKQTTKSYSSVETDDGEKYVTESYVSLLKNKLV